MALFSVGSFAQSEARTDCIMVATMTGLFGIGANP
jgi:hypothetical protein